MIAELDEDGIEIDSIYEHNKTGKLYETESFCKFQVSDTLWVAGIIYTPPGEFNKKYACSLTDFVKQFKEL